MLNHVTPIRLKGNRVYLPTLGLITIPCGISIRQSRVNGSPSLLVYGKDQKVVESITIANPTPENWLLAFKKAIKLLSGIRERLLCRRALKEKTPHGPIPGSGQPGVYHGRLYPTPRAIEPLERRIVYTSTLGHAVRLREAAEERYYEHWAFDESKLIPTIL